MHKRLQEINIVYATDPLIMKQIPLYTAFYVGLLMTFVGFIVAPFILKVFSL